MVSVTIYIKHRHSDGEYDNGVPSCQVPRASRLRVRDAATWITRYPLGYNVSLKDFMVVSYADALSQKCLVFLHCWHTTLRGTGFSHGDRIQRRVRPDYAHIREHGGVAFTRVVRLFTVHDTRR